MNESPPCADALARPGNDDRSEEGELAEGFFNRLKRPVQIVPRVRGGDGEAEPTGPGRDGGGPDPLAERSEERRVGKECRL